jgi:hypothetical protein
MTRSPRARPWLLPALFASGLAIAMLMTWRMRVGIDALDLLTRGWLLTVKGVWVPLGNEAAPGGYVPGGLTALLVGGPLALWMDPRAPVVLVLCCHVVAYALLDRVVGEALGRRARVLFAVFYWLNPWQLFQAAWLDNTNYGFLSGAVHLWACYRQRLRGRFLHSAVLVAAVGLTGQLHLHAMLLVFAAVLLWLRGYWKPHWGGVAAGSALAIASLIPFLLEAWRHPEVIPGGEDPFLRGLVTVWPVVKGVLYWLRYASLHFSSSMRVFDFTPSLGATADALLSPFYFVLGNVVGGASVVLPVLANAWVWRRFRTVRRGLPGVAPSRRDWMRGYAVWLFVACLVANATSPTEVMYWHNLIAFHAAVLPMVLWVEAMSRTRRAALVRRAVVAHLSLSLVFLLGMSVGADVFREGGRHAVAFTPHTDHELLHDLGLDAHPNRRPWPRQEGYFYRVYASPYELPADSAAGAPTPAD